MEELAFLSTTKKNFVFNYRENSDKLLMKKSREILENLAKPFLRRHDEGAGEDLKSIAARDHQHFSYDALVTATSNFSAKNKLGEGGFGAVYKGRLEDGREIAVKKLSRGSRQGSKEFMNEAILLARVQHKNVVNLYGYCTAPAGADGYSEKLLVYELVTHDSLDKILFKSEKRRILDWRKRMEIIAGVARGLLYLHEDAHTTIIHRDIKASNVLLDDRWFPKIADFGMARLFPEDQTHVQTCVAGTSGYMAPEYVMHGQLSTKADVFSFGVVVLELITGRKNSSFIPVIDSQTLLEWAWRLHKKNKSMDMVDEVLRPWTVAEAEQMERCIHLGLLCVQRDPKLRPDMRRVGLALCKRSNSLEQPAMPGIPFTMLKTRSSDPLPSTLVSSSSSSSSRPSFRRSSRLKSSSSTGAMPPRSGKAPLET